MSFSVKQTGAAKQTDAVKQTGAALRHPALNGRAGGWSWLMRAFQAISTRRALMELDDRTLADLGISRAQAQFEAERPFWDLRGVPRR